MTPINIPEFFIEFDWMEIDWLVFRLNECRGFHLIGKGFSEGAD
jgi:hypothetical protein